jgi:hypothetical protein
MGHWRQLLDRETLASWDLGGADQVVVIAKVGRALMETPGKKKGHKGLIHFADGRKGPIKPMVSGPTILKQIEKATGEEDPKNWVGKRITIYATKCNGEGGEEVDCIRVRPKAPAAGAALSEGNLTQPVDEEARAKQKSSAGDTSLPGTPIGKHLVDEDDPDKGP